MRDYKSPWWRDYSDNEVERDCNILCVAASLIMLVLVIGVMTTSCVDGIVRTVETEEEQRIFRVEKTYEKPAAYRLASPTWDEVEHMVHLRQVQKVMK